MQRTYNPLDHGFEFSNDWYTFDRKAAHAAALKQRNREARDLRKQGYAVTCFTLGEQLVSRGGIGSGNPHIELVVSVFGLNASKVRTFNLSASKGL